MTIDKELKEQLDALREDAEETVDSAQSVQSVYKGAARIGSDLGTEFNNGDNKLTMLQETVLSEQERKVLRLALRGFTTTTIAKIIGLSVHSVQALRTRVRNKLQNSGSKVDQGYLVGFTVSVFEEVEAKAWELYYNTADAKNSTRDKSKALELVMKAREKQLKLMMDVGLIQKADNTVVHEVTMTPFLEKWDQDGKQAMVKALLESTLDKLEDPVAPDSEYTGVQDQDKEEDE